MASDRADIINVNESAVSDRPERGFSLIEILIVVVVLGVIATVTVFAVRGVAANGQEKACGAEARVLETAAAVYMADNAVDEIPPTAPLDGEQFERTLVDADFLKAVSLNLDLNADGTVTSDGDPCP